MQRIVVVAALLASAITCKQERPATPAAIESESAEAPAPVQARAEATELTAAKLDAWLGFQRRMFDLSIEFLKAPFWADDEPDPGRKENIALDTARLTKRMMAWQEKNAAAVEAALNEAGLTAEEEKRIGGIAHAVWNTALMQDLNQRVQAVMAAAPKQLEEMRAKAVTMGAPAEVLAQLDEQIAEVRRNQGEAPAGMEEVEKKYGAATVALVLTRMDAWKKLLKEVDAPAKAP